MITDAYIDEDRLKRDNRRSRWVWAGIMVTGAILGLLLVQGVMYAISAAFGPGDVSGMEVIMSADSPDDVTEVTQEHITSLCVELGLVGGECLFDQAQADEFARRWIENGADAQGVE